MAGAWQKDPRQYLVTRVHSVADVSESMREIWLRAPALATWRCSPGAHVVVRVPVGATHARRVYSLWTLRADLAAVALRVLTHDDAAPGCVWARTVRPGDQISIERPRSKITIDTPADFHLFAGDETASVPLLAMHAAIARGTATGTSRPPAIGVFEASGAAGEVPGMPGVEPPGWIHRGSASPVGSRVLLAALRDLRLPRGRGTAYLAGESSTCQLLARHLVEERGWLRRSVKLQPHWAPGRPGFGAGPDDPRSARPSASAAARQDRSG
jgi:NADPH-dependent ferric siderophore reductase